MDKRLLIQSCVMLLLTHYRSVDMASITKYDQSQHGTYNVQIHLKNLEVIAILDDTMFSGGAESDIYDYDYTDVSAAFEKPSNSTNSTLPSTPPTTTPHPPTVVTTPTVTTAPTLGSTTYASANKTTANRLTTIVNTKVTPRPTSGGQKTNVTAAQSGGKPTVNAGGSSTSKYNATNVLNVVVPATATKAPHNKISEADHPAPAKVTTPQPATTAGTTIVTPPSDGADYTLMDTISVPVEIQQPPSAHPSPMLIRKCAPGYFRDSSGKCRRIRKPHLPFLQMVHTPGVIKSFQTESSTKKMMVPEVAHSKMPKEEKLVLELANKLAKEEVAAKMAKEDLGNVTMKE
ncbi:mucin-2-like isoform X2 [Diaphorina citri]|uniref:Mucin-2-like isoform X2 n=1 Tax=Diaphorina citri TaxID=121845 RepID=A0A1S3D2K0_DIACI|nr:mucin-2-like isoform X2 [Diaphorina citri]KAI5718514.1 hypothetical protein M8J77_022352 [Diaphorina citri]